MEKLDYVLSFIDMSFRYVINHFFDTDIDSSFASSISRSDKYSKG